MTTDSLIGRVEARRDKMLRQNHPDTISVAAAKSAFNEAIAIIRLHEAEPSQDAVERVAEAIWQAVSIRANKKTRRITWEEAGQPTHDEFLPLARAAIAAMRAPAPSSAETGQNRKAR